MKSEKVDKVNRCCGNCSNKIIEQLDALLYAIRAEQLKVLRDCPFKLTQMEGTIMAFFASNPGATLSDLVAYTARDKGQMARLIKNLRKHLLLEPFKDSDDKRSVKLQLTEMGMEVNRTLKSELDSVARIALGNMNESDRDDLSSKLNVLLHNLWSNEEA